MGQSARVPQAANAQDLSSTYNNLSIWSRRKITNKNVIMLVCSRWALGGPGLDQQ